MGFFGLYSKGKTGKGRQHGACRTSTLEQKQRRLPLPLAAAAEVAVPRRSEHPSKPPPDTEQPNPQERRQKDVDGPVRNEAHDTRSTGSVAGAADSTKSGTVHRSGKCGQDVIRPESSMSNHSRRHGRDRLWPHAGRTDSLSARSSDRHASGQEAAPTAKMAGSVHQGNANFLQTRADAVKRNHRVADEHILKQHLRVKSWALFKWSPSLDVHMSRQTSVNHEADLQSKILVHDGRGWNTDLGLPVNHIADQLNEQEISVIMERDKRRRQRHQHAYKERLPSQVPRPTCPVQRKESVTRATQTSPMTRPLTILPPAFPDGRLMSFHARDDEPYHRSLISTLPLYLSDHYVSAAVGDSFSARTLSNQNSFDHIDENKQYEPVLYKASDDEDGDDGDDTETIDGEGFFADALNGLLRRATTLRNAGPHMLSALHGNSNETINNLELIDGVEHTTEKRHSFRATSQATEYTNAVSEFDWLDSNIRFSDICTSPLISLHNTDYTSDHQSSTIESKHETYVHRDSVRSEGSWIYGKLHSVHPVVRKSFSRSDRVMSETFFQSGVPLRKVKVVQSSLDSMPVSPLLVLDKQKMQEQET